MNSRTLVAALSLLALISVSLAHDEEPKCAPLFAKCGGKGYSGPTCCAQPTPLPGYVEYVAPGSIVCKKQSKYYSQCKRRCPRDKPCLAMGTTCTASIDGNSDGRGRQWCGVNTSCTNPDWCFSDVLSCVCGGDVPCAWRTRPGGCRPLELLDDGSMGCGGGSERCPAFEGEQCGGKGHDGPTECQPGLTCVKESKYYSACRSV